MNHPSPPQGAEGLGGGGGWMKDVGKTVTCPTPISHDLGGGVGWGAEVVLRGAIRNHRRWEEVKGVQISRN